VVSAEGPIGIQAALQRRETYQVVEEEAIVERLTSIVKGKDLLFGGGDDGLRDTGILEFRS